MADTNRPKGYTPPKGTATPRRDERTRARNWSINRRARVQWAAVLLVAVMVFGVAIAFGSGSGSGGGETQPGVHSN